MSISTTSAYPPCATYCAVVAPTAPAPTTVPFPRIPLPPAAPHHFSRAPPSAPPPPLEARRPIHDALPPPLGAPTLDQLAGPGARVCIAVTDATRACPDKLLVLPICTALELAGVAQEDITILVATGLH